MDYLASVLIGIVIGWLGRGYAMLRRAKASGRSFSVSESARNIIAGGKV